MNKPDMVNHPPHYNNHPSGVEVIDITEHMNFCLGNVIKYVLRCDLKGSPLEDLRKAEFYLKREIKRREAVMELDLVKEKRIEDARDYLHELQQSKRS